MPASHTRNGWSDARVGASTRVDLVLALQANLPYPVCRLGSRRARLGKRATRHRNHAVCVLHTAHGRWWEGGQGEWEGGKGDPNETPRPSRRVGWGIVV